MNGESPRRRGDHCASGFCLSSAAQTCCHIRPRGDMALGIRKALERNVAKIVSEPLSLPSHMQLTVNPESSTFSQMVQFADFAVSAQSWYQHLPSHQC